MGTAANLLTNMGLGRARRLVERKQLQMRRRFSACLCFWVAQRFTAAITAMLLLPALSR
jgi:hypothetical protein